MTDAQKEIVNALPLEQRRSAINEFTATASRGPHAAKGGRIEGVPTLEELEDIKRKYGAGSQKWRDAYKKVRESRI